MQSGVTSTDNLKRSIMELHGLGAEQWRGIDVEDHVRQLRAQWDDRSQPGWMLRSGVCSISVSTHRRLSTFVEATPRYDALVMEIFQRVSDGKVTGITTAITLLEVLVRIAIALAAVVTRLGSMSVEVGRASIFNGPIEDPLLPER